eukprot:EG_transcript_8644
MAWAAAGDKPHTAAKKLTHLPKVEWRRVRGVAHEPYRCRNGSAPPPPATLRPCLTQAYNRIESMQKRKLWAYPVSFCFPRAVAGWYHDLFWNATKTANLTASKHGRFLKGVRVYGTADEEAYLAKYAAARTVFTKRKAGWDCLRHLEILVAGALYRFRDPSGLDPLTMFHHPKECFAEMAAAASLSDAEYGRLRQEVWEFFRNHLTCDSLVRFMMRAAGFDPCASGPVLFLDRYLARHIDYQANSVFAGLRDVLGPNLHVWQEPHYMYADWDGDYRKLYGNGMGFAMALDPALHSPGVPDGEVVRRLRAGYYKLVVYGSVTRSAPFWAEVTAALPAARVWAVVGEDEPAGWESFFVDGRSLRATAFIREMRSANFHCPEASKATEPPRDVSGRSPTCPSDEQRAAQAPCGAEEVRCVRQASARIWALNVSRRVYPVSLCLPMELLQRYGHLSDRQRTKSVFHWADQRGKVDVTQLSHYHFATLPPGDEDSLALLQTYLAGAIPVRPASSPVPPLALFHHPKECFAPPPAPGSP